MKIRNGFVSNSSSSSFIIHKSAFKNDEEYEKFVDKIQELDEKSIEDDYKVYWGDSYQNVSTFHNFITVETFRAPDEVKSLLDHYNITEDNENVYVIYG